jgi:hypothetical protein
VVTICVLTALYHLIHCPRRSSGVRLTTLRLTLLYCYTPQHGRGVMTYASDRSSDVVERYDGEWFEGKMQVRRVLSIFVVSQAAAHCR